MARSSSTIQIKVIADASQAAREMQGASDASDDFASSLKKFAGGLAVGAVFKEMISAASDFEQALGGTDKIFGDSAKTIHDWASDTSDDFRVPATAAEQFATSLGNSLIQAGRDSATAAEDVKKLGQVGADLAAAFGGSTVEAIDAINGAISKGEWERLESFGVTVKQADITAEMEKIAGGADKITAANRGAIETQARINVLMKEAAPALGSAASEADTFAAKQEQFNEVLQQFLVAVGGPLLDVLGEFLGGLSGLLPIVTPLAVAIAELLGWVLELPAPLLLAAGALIGWQVIGGLAGITLAFSKAVDALTASFKRLQAGTIIGAVLLGIVAAMSAIDAIFDDSEQGIQDAADAWQRWIDTADEATGAATGATRELVAQEIVASGLADTLDELGIPLDHYVDGVTGVAGASETMARDVEKATQALFDQDGAFGDIAASAKAAGLSQQDVLDAAASGDWTAATAKMQAYADSQAALTGDASVAAKIMDDFRAALAAGQQPAEVLTGLTSAMAEGQRKFAESGKDAEQALRGVSGAAEAAVPTTEAVAAAFEAMKDNAKAAAENTELQTTLGDIDDASRRAAEGMDFINSAIDDFTGRTADIDQAKVDWAALLRPPSGEDAKSAFATYNEGVSTAVANLNKWDTAQLGSTESGEALFTQLTGMKEGYDELNAAVFENALQTGTTEDAVAALATQSAATRDSFIGWAAPMAAAGVDVQALADKLGILDLTELSPKFLEVLVADENAQATLATLQASNIDPKTIVVTADDQATKEIESAITFVDGATGKTRTIKLDADPKDADAVLRAVLGDVEDAVPKPIPLDADPKKAEDVATAFQTEDRETKEVRILGNSAPARNAFDAFIRDYANIDITAEIFANTSPAIGTIQSLEAGYYQATVTVVADTSSFFQTFNSLPRSSGISAVPNIAAPLLPRSSGPTSPTARSQNVFNISGVVGSPDDVARAVEKVIRDRDRRIGAVFVS